MQALRRRLQTESVLDLYNLVLALLLFVSPWLFALQNHTAKMDLWVSGAAIAMISLGAIKAYANLGRMGQPASWDMAGRFALGGGICPHPRHAFQHRHRVRRSLSRRPRSMAAL
jgi:hypothetical protein